MISTWTWFYFLHKYRHIFENTYSSIFQTYYQYVITNTRQACYGVRPSLTRFSLPCGCLTQPAGHQYLTSFREEVPWWGIQLRFTMVADTRLHSVQLMTHWGLLTHWGYRKVVSKYHMLRININLFSKKYTMKSVVPGSCTKIVYRIDPLITGVMVINSHWHSHWLSHWLSLTLSLTFSPTNWLTNWLAGSLAHSFTHSHSHTLTHTAAL